jgi:hypothetical protein
MASGRVAWEPCARKLAAPNSPRDASDIKEMAAASGLANTGASMDVKL